MTSAPRLDPQLLELVGAIVLSTQEAERYLKIILPFTHSADPSLRAALTRHERLKRRPLGELVGKFVDSLTVESPAMELHLADLVARRNHIVHHFAETYGRQMRSGESKQVINSLRTLLANVNIFCDVLERLALQLLEAMRDTTFLNTPEYQDIDNLCASFRRHIAN